MSTINDTDLLLVERNGVQYQITYDQMSTLNDDDLLLVERGGVQYKVEAQHVSAGASGLIIPPVEVLTPVNGAGITEFTSYEPVSSAITAVGEAGTIAKETDEIQSVTVATIPQTWTYTDGNSFTGPLEVGSYLQSLGVTAITGIKLYLDNVSGFPYTAELTSLTIDGNDYESQNSVTPTNITGTPYNSQYSFESFFSTASSYGSVQGTSDYSCNFSDISFSTSVQINFNSLGGRISVFDQSGGEHFVVGPAGPTVLSFPTNTNFSGLSVGDEVQTGVTITAIDAAATPPTVTVDGGDWDTSNQSQVWSSGTYTGTAASNNYGVTDLFANVGNAGDPFGANKMWGLYQATATFTLDNPIPLTSNSTLELITYQSSSSSGSITLTGSAGSLVPTLTVNGTNVFGSTTVSDPYASLGDSITAITIAASGADWTALEGIIIDGKHVIDAGTSGLGDRKLSSSIPYEKSLTFTDTTELANMVGPLEMTDANGDVVTPVSDTIANVSGNVLTLQGDTNLAYFQPGDEVQTGVQVVSVDAAAPSITVDGGSWLGADGSGSTYEISKSLRFNSADSAYMHWTPSSAGNQKTWTWSGWVKRVNFGEECVLFSGSASPGANYYLTFSGGTGTGTGADGLSFFYGYGIHVGTAANVFRDPNAWYHVVLALDTTQSTAADRVKIYVNGTEVTYSYTNYPSQNADLGINSSYRMSMGAINSFGAWSLSDMYLAEVNFIDGLALAPTAFGNFDSNGIWQAEEASIPNPNNGTTWSSSSYNAVTGTTGSTDMTNAFDGDLSTFTSLGSGDGSTTATVVFTPPSSITVNTGVRVYIGVDRGQSISVNGSQTNASVSAGWNDVSFTGTLTSLSIGPTNVGSSNHIAAIEIDGVVLVDGATGYGTNGFYLDFSDSSSDAALGYDAAGSNDWIVNNLSAPPSNTGQYASNFESSNGFKASYPAMNAFDGSTSTYAQATATGGNLTFTPSTPIAYSSSIKINMPSAGASASVNGGSAVSVANSSETTIATGSGTLTSLVLTASNLPGLVYIKIDDQILVNTGVDSGTDSLPDSPTSNYATLNPLDANGSTSLSNGNLDMGNSQGGSAWGTNRATIGASSGKYFAEYTCTASSGGFRQVIGVVSMEVANTGGAAPSNVSLNNLSDSAAYFNNGQKSLNGSTSSYGDAWTVGDVIGIALDVDATTVTFYKNGVSQGVASSDLASDAALTFGGGTISSNETGSWNFGQRDFAYPVSGFEALTVANFEPTIKDSSKHFDVVTYTGNGSTQTISGLGFSPDLVWYKTRNGIFHHGLQDSVRGVGKSLSTSTTSGEYNESSGITAFTPDGFTLDGTGFYYVNSNNEMVAWCWNAGDTTETIAAGSLNSSVYDQSQTWSNGLSGSVDSSYPITQAFDGSFSTVSYATAGNTATVTLPGGSITLDTASSLRVYAARAGSISSFYVNGNDYTTQISASAGWYTITGETQITSIGIGNTSGSHYTGLYAVEVNGKPLIDYGVSVDDVPDIASEVRASQESGFSITKYTGNGSQSRVAHGLGKAPEMVITKAITGASRWAVHMPTIIGGNYYLELNSNSGKQSWGSQTLGDPTSTTFDTVYANGVNESGIEYVAYSFTSIPQFSKIGSYIGNGSATDGPAIFTGFEPAFLLIKNTGGDDWYIFDNERSDTKPLFANGSYGEQPDNRQVEFLSNGFKIRYDRFFNASGAEMIYMAIAEKPLNTTPEADTSADTQVALDALVAAATEIVETDGTTMYLNGATGPWRTGLSIEGSQVNAAAPGPSEITFTSQNQGTPAFSGVDATLASRTWTLESGTTATGPWTLVDTYVDYGVLSTQTGATPWTENKPTLQPNTFYRIKVQYDSTNATSVESVYNTFKTGDA